MTEKEHYQAGTGLWASEVNYKTQKIRFWNVLNKRDRSTHPVLYNIIITILQTYVQLIWQVVLLLVLLRYTVLHNVPAIELQKPILLFYLIIIWIPIIQGILVAGTKYGQKYILPKQHNVITRFTMPWLEQKTNQVTINKQLIRHNEAIIPAFHNKEIHYKATKDFATKLQKISIINIWKDADDDWQAVFKYKTKPTSGELKIWYN